MADIATKVRTHPRHSRENGNPSVARLSRWIPACAGMTEKSVLWIMATGISKNGKNETVLAVF